MDNTSNRLLSLFLLLTVAWGQSPMPPYDGGQCIWYGKCVQNPASNNTDFFLNCHVTGDDALPRPVPPQSYQGLMDSCPHFVEDFGPDPSTWQVCCDADQVYIAFRSTKTKACQVMRFQINDIVENFILPQGLLQRCPACYYNFRKNFCDLTCRPDQSAFLDPVVKTYPNFEGCFFKVIFILFHSCHYDYIQVFQLMWWIQLPLSCTLITMKGLMTLARASLALRPRDRLCNSCVALGVR